jgi:hypothetical protein
MQIFVSCRILRGCCRWFLHRTRDELRSRSLNLKRSHHTSSYLNIHPHSCRLSNISHRSGGACNSGRHIRSFFSKNHTQTNHGAGSCSRERFVNVALPRPSEHFLLGRSTVHVPPDCDLIVYITYCKRRIARALCEHFK